MVGGRGRGGGGLKLICHKEGGFVKGAVSARRYPSVY